MTTSSNSNGLLARILSATANEQAARKAAALRKAGIRASKTYVENLETDLDRLKDQAAELLEISATTDLNRALKTVSVEDIEQRVVQYHKMLFDIDVLQQQYDKAVVVHAELVGNVAEEA